MSTGSKPSAAKRAAWKIPFGSNTAPPPYNVSSGSIAATSSLSSEKSLIAVTNAPDQADQQKSRHKGGAFCLMKEMPYTKLESGEAVWTGSPSFEGGLAVIATSYPIRRSGKRKADVLDMEGKDESNPLQPIFKRPRTQPQEFDVVQYLLKLEETDGQERTSQPPSSCVSSTGSDNDSDDETVWRLVQEVLSWALNGEPHRPHDGEAKNISASTSTNIKSGLSIEEVRESVGDADASERESSVALVSNLQVSEVDEATDLNAVITACLSTSSVLTAIDEETNDEDDEFPPPQIDRVYHDAYDGALEGYQDENEYHQDLARQHGDRAIQSGEDEDNVEAEEVGVEEGSDLRHEGDESDAESDEDHQEGAIAPPTAHLCDTEPRQDLHKQDEGFHGTDVPAGTGVGNDLGSSAPNVADNNEEDPEKHPSHHEGGTVDTAAILAAIESGKYKDIMKLLPRSQHPVVISGAVEVAAHLPELKAMGKELTKLKGGVAPWKAIVCNLRMEKRGSSLVTTEPCKVVCLVGEGSRDGGTRGRHMQTVHFGKKRDL